MIEFEEARDRGRRTKRTACSCPVPPKLPMIEVVLAFGDPNHGFIAGNQGQEHIAQGRPHMIGHGQGCWNTDGPRMQDGVMDIVQFAKMAEKTPRERGRVCGEACIRTPPRHLCQGSHGRSALWE